ncbi:MAG: hypothetical protein HY606_05290 [Planctomycetes bacterium]|nr:hypothetical protein [Planctomycetota bacterium]
MINGIVYSWGANNYGQLGIGNFSAGNPSPTPIPGLTSVIAIKAGGFHNFAIQYDYDMNISTLWAWGSNFFGQLGTGDTIDRPSPTIIMSLFANPGYPTFITPIVSLAAGGWHSSAVIYDSAVLSYDFYSWGLNSSGQLCDGTTVNRTAPLRVFSIPNQIFDSLPSLVSAGLLHTIIKISYFVYSCGDNSVGQLGNGTSGNISTTPVFVSLFTNYSSIAAGVFHNYVSAPGFTPPEWSFGWGERGQLGTGNTNNAYSPVPIYTIPPSLTYPTLSLPFIAHMSAGGAHTVRIVTPNGMLYTWGDNTFGQLGLGNTPNGNAPFVTTPTQVVF